MKVWKRAAAALLVLTAGAAFAGRPLAIDNADPVDRGWFELELGTEYETDSACSHLEVPFGLSYGLLPGLQAGAAFGGQLEEREEATGRDRECGIGDLELGAKWKVMQEQTVFPALALAGAIKLPTADEDKDLGSGETDYDLTGIASKMLTDRIGLHVNAGYTWVGEPDGEEVGDVAHYGAALEVQLTGALQWAGEVFAEKELQDGTQTVVQGNTGLRWNPSENLTLDIAAGGRLAGNDAPDFTAAAGLTWAFEIK